MAQQKARGAASIFHGGRASHNETHRLNQGPGSTRPASCANARSVRQYQAGEFEDRIADAMRKRSLDLVIVSRNKPKASSADPTMHRGANGE